MKNKLNVDKLELAFTTDEETLKLLESENEIKTRFFYLLRKPNDNNYRNTFEVYFDDGMICGSLYFGTYNINRPYVYFMVANECFYNGRLTFLYTLQCCLNLDFKLISKLDLALDYNVNIVNRFYKLLKDKELDFIILNKRINFETEIKDLLNVSTGSRLRIHKFKSFYIQNKEKGLSLNCYDKRKEIEDNNNTKQYIIDKFNYSKIFRLEVRTNHCLLKDSIDKLGFTDEYVYNCLVRNINDKLYLLYLNLLQRLIRIQYKSKVYSLVDFL